MTALYATLLAVAMAVGYLVAVGAADPLFAAGAVLLGYIFLVSALELRRPFERRWVPTRLDVRDDAIFFVTTLLASAVGSAAAAGLGPWGQSSIGRQLADTSPVLAFFTALVIADCCMYWVHRSFHEPILGERIFGWLWPLHRVHHRQKKLYLFNNSRMHPINQLLNSSVRSAPLVLLGFPPDVCAGAIFTISLVSYLAHANLDVRDSSFLLLFNTPAFHRVHHNRSPEVAQNFGSFLAVWDHLFGTYRNPGIPPDVGLSSAEDRPTSLLAQFIRP